MDSGPVSTFQVHEYLRPKVYFISFWLSILLLVFLKHYRITDDVLLIIQLCDLYENDSIFDKFECCLSGDSQRVATGSYR
jgi:serine/threonine-protein phosphatase 2A regulatory subunit B